MAKLERITLERFHGKTTILISRSVTHYYILISYLNENKLNPRLFIRLVVLLPNINQRCKDTWIVDTFSMTNFEMR